MGKCTQCGAYYEGAEAFCPVDGARIDFEGEEGHVDPEAPEEDQYLGKIIQGRYRVISRLGEGGMGVVYVAEHVEIEKKVALKLLRDDFSSRPDVVERFRQEARSASKIGHPHIVDVTDFGQLDDGGVFFAMECLEGCGLNDICRGEPVPLERAAPIIDQIARALKAAHEKGIVHRDMKPENVFLVNSEERNDFVKILDFGIAKISDRDNEGKRLTKTGMIFGTPEYMSPEQAAGKSLDHRVDIYAVGCIMYELFTGHVPYDGDSFMAVLTQHMFEPIPDILDSMPNTDVPESVRAVVYKAMAKETKDRYQEMEELRKDLERALVDANYIVEHPGRETTIRFDAKGAKGNKPTADQISTMMDWAPGTGAVNQPGKGSKAPLIIGLVLGILLIGGGVGAYMGGLFGKGTDNGQGTGPVVGPANPQPHANLNHPTVDTGAAVETPPVPDTQVAQPVPESPKMIKVGISSDPEGAVIEIEGKGQVCSSAPCDLDLEIGQTVEISARSGKRKQTVTFTPSDQNKAVALVLKAKGGGGGKPGGGKPGGGKPGGGKPGGGKPGGGKPGGDKPGGLKIPDLFKDN